MSMALLITVITVGVWLGASVAFVVILVIATAITGRKSRAAGERAGR